MSYQKNKHELYLKDIDKEIRDARKIDKSSGILYDGAREEHEELSVLTSEKSKSIDDKTE